MAPGRPCSEAPPHLGRCLFVADNEFRTLCGSDLPEYPFTGWSISSVGPVSHSCLHFCTVSGALQGTDARGCRERLKGRSVRRKSGSLSSCEKPPVRHRPSCPREQPRSSASFSWPLCVSVGVALAGWFVPHTLRCTLSHARSLCLLTVHSVPCPFP